ncbi:hypothetical protein [Methylobacterium sp. WL103]|nr:hypothetical protein [Methylobacterium sp. WL103]
MTLKLNLPASQTSVFSDDKRAQLVRDHGEEHAAKEPCSPHA